MAGRPLPATVGAAGDRLVLVLGSLSINASGRLNLAGNDLIIRNASAANVFNQLKLGFNAAAGGYWNGQGGIVSSMAAVVPPVRVISRAAMATKR